MCFGWSDPFYKSLHSGVSLPTAQVYVFDVVKLWILTLRATQEASHIMILTLRRSMIGEISDKNDLAF